MGTVGILVAVLCISDGLHNLYPVPVGVQLVGDNAWQARAIATTHLRAMTNDEYRAVGVDRQVHVWLEHRLVHRAVAASGRRCVPQRAREELRPQHERARSDHAPQKATTADIFDFDHALTLKPRSTKIHRNPSRRVLYPTRIRGACNL